MKDPNYASLAVWVMGEGTPGSQILVDQSPVPKTFTTSANVTISNAHSKWGTTSIYSNAAAVQTTTNIVIGSAENYTMAGWVYLTAFPNDSLLFGSNTGSTETSSTLMIHNSKLCYAWYIDGPTTVVTNRYYHVALARSSGVLKWFLDGVVQGSINDTRSWNHPFYLGGGGRTVGYFNDVTVLKGVALWTSNFTPPNEPYSLVSYLAQGSARFTDGAVADKVRAFRHDTGAFAYDIVPDSEGNFTLDSGTNTSMDFMLLKTGYRPLMHGPIGLGGPF